MRRWKLLIILTSAAAALAVGLGARAPPEDFDLLALLTNAIDAIT
jgi:hypothetical protein